MQRGLTERHFAKHDDQTLPIAPIPAPRNFRCIQSIFIVHTVPRLSLGLLSICNLHFSKFSKQKRPAFRIAFDFARSISAAYPLRIWLVSRVEAQRVMLGKPIVALFATVFFSRSFPSHWLARMAIAASPSTFAMGVFGSGSASSSTRDLVLSLIAVGVELALFILIPIYVRSRQRAKIWSRIRILYDSRFEPALAMRVAQIPTGSPLLRPTKSARPVREVPPSGIGW
jgi:hypothetical protein